MARRTLRGAGRGERRSRRRGGTVEFADTRAYLPGDDVRQIDWYAFARLEQLLLKLYVEEQDLTVHLLVDHSASMGAGAPPKLPYARQLALALAYVALTGGDRVTCRAFRAGEPTPGGPPLRGRRGLLQLVRALEADDAARGRTSLGAAVRAFLARRPTPGVVVVLSDLFDGGGYQRPLEQLRYSGYEVHVLHVVAPDEVSPEPGADAELVCAETGEAVTVALDQRAVADYRAAFAAFAGGVASFCRRHELGYARALTSVPVDELVLGALRRGALVR